MTEFLVLDALLCCQCGLCASVAPGELDPEDPARLVLPTTTTLLAMAECPNSAITWARDAARAV